MEFKQQLGLNVSLKQNLVMTPQLQQAIKLLQLSRVELLESVQQELLENPALAEEDGDSTRPDIPKVETTGEYPAAREASQHEREQAEARQGTSESSQRQDDRTESSAEQQPQEVQEVAGAEDREPDWDQYVEYFGQQSYSGGGGVRGSDDDLPSVAQTLAVKESLADHLDWQLGLTQFTEAEEKLADSIVGNLDQRGFLNGELLPELAEQAGLELDEAEAVLEVIQALDPIGVGSRDLRECLLVQALHYYPHEDVAHAVLRDHLEDLEKRNIKPILRTLGIEEDDLRDAMDLIGSLEPRPGRAFMTDQTHYIIPDVYVVKVGDEYVIQLNEDGESKLKISRFYEHQVKSSSGETREYIQQKLRSAEWFIKSIHQRQQTIRKVTTSIVHFQREFLDKGVSFLRPLILRDVAEDIGMHESTISRVTTNKYVHTPQGTFELKYFFNSRIQTAHGPDLASESVKQRIKKLIGEEDPAKPLSDQRLCALLAEEGTEIARRTVAKYRENLNIPSSSRRKRIF